MSRRKLTIDRGLMKAFMSHSFRHSKRLRWYCGPFENFAFPPVAACYVFTVNGIAVYVGSTSNMNARMRQHRNKWQGVFDARDSVLVKYRPTKKYGDWAMRELRLLRKLRPAMNTIGGAKIHGNTARRQLVIGRAKSNG